MLSIIVPNKDEPNIQKFIAGLEALRYRSEIIVSRDRDGKGKGWAIRQALLQAKGDYFVFVDGDYDIAPSEINKLICYMKQYDVIVGRKRILYVPFTRKLITIFSRLYIKVLFNIGVDTQTGIKLFNYKPEFKTDGFGCDIEILYKAKKAGKKMIEIPVEAKISKKKGWHDLCKTLKESLIIKFLS